MAADDVQLPDLEVIQRYSIAVRSASAPRAEVIAALQADLDWLTSGGGRPPAAQVPARTPSRTPAKGTKAPAKAAARTPSRGAAAKAPAPPKRTPRRTPSRTSPSRGSSTPPSEA